MTRKNRRTRELHRARLRQVYSVPARAIAADAGMSANTFVATIVGSFLLAIAAILLSH